MSDQRSPTVFICEDDEAVLDLLVTRLRIAGYHTVHERDGFNGFEMIRRLRPTACILDINMPRMTGFEVLKRMRSEPLTSHIPVLMLTARKGPDDIKMAIKLGATDYLCKPFSQDQLLARVARLVRKRTEDASKAPAFD
jgi:two-component system OmpR family response regulator